MKNVYFKEWWYSQRNGIVVSIPVPLKYKLQWLKISNI